MTQVQEKSYICKDKRGIGVMESAMKKTQLERFNEIKSSNKLFLTAAEIAPVLEVDAHSVRGQARDRPDMLGFPVVVYGSRVKVPRLPFVQFVESLPCSCQINRRNEESA